MGRLRLISALLMAGWSLCASAQDINTDVKTIEQELLNTALQEGVEILHNQQVDTIKKKQNKLMEMTASYSTLKNLYAVTLQNVKGFGPESGVYRSIVTTSLDIASHGVSATEAIFNSNITGKAIAAYKIADLVTEAAHLGNLFFNIVNNATIANPLARKMSGAESPKNDKYNFLNRHERLSMALKICAELKKIDHRLVMIIYYCRHNSLSALLMHMDRETWITYHYANFSSRKLINQWNSLVK